MDTCRAPLLAKCYTGIGSMVTRARRVLLTTRRGSGFGAMLSPFPRSSFLLQQKAAQHADGCFHGDSQQLGRASNASTGLRVSGSKKRAAMNPNHGEEVAHGTMPNAQICLCKNRFNTRTTTNTRCSWNILYAWNR